MSIVQSNFLNFKNIRHAFSIRSGGLSPYPWNSLNCSFFVGDKENNVIRNKKKILNKLGFKNDFFIKQIHGNRIVNAEDFIGSKKIVEADGIICKTYDLPISITTADCAPILMADPINNIIGAAHAGWRGSLNGVIDNLIDKFKINGSNLENIYTVIGPCISKESFEVKADMIEYAVKKDEESNYFFSNINNCYFFNLQGYLKDRMKKNGLQNIYCLSEDTYKNPDKFFSYRYETKNNNFITGRMINIIGLISEKKNKNFLASG